MKRIHLAFAAIAACAFAATVQAQDPVATLSATQGNILVNQGSQFVPADPGLALMPGDRVLAQANGNAEITFTADGCKASVLSGTMVTVPSTSTCKGGMLLVQNTNPAMTGALGAGTAAGTGAFAGASAVGTAAFAVALGGSLYTVGHNIEQANDDDRPISP
jgi:hypothetical protein